ncbi:MAG: rRNA adenine dimethyltransferase family protein [Thermoleophilia bacterium]
MSAPRVRVLRLLESHGLRPDTDLGQHFLVDENLVDLSLREAGVGPQDIVLEVGAGAGVLTAALARAAAAVHAVELDTRLRPLLEEVLDGAAGVHVHWADAMKLPLEDLDPQPTLLVSNLPYNIATPLRVESTWRLPGLRGWCVMTQRRSPTAGRPRPATRCTAPPACCCSCARRRRSRRNVGREVFVPRPRVDSALVAFRRTAPGADATVRACVRAAFAQRRKTLVNTLSAAGVPKPAVAAALEALGRPATTRAQDLSPSEHLALARALPWPS